MPLKTVRGFAWYAFPETFGLETEDHTDPGHPFGSCPGEVLAPAEVLYFRPAHPADSGVRNEHRAHSYLVLTKTQLHPKLCKGWDSDPAVLTDKFKTEDGRVRMVRIVELHHRHIGDLMECELKVDEG